MLDLYTHATPNGYKITIALEELALPYTAHAVDISSGQQFSDEIISLNPNAKIPILRDNDTGNVISESSAILLYLAAKTGKLFPSIAAGTDYWNAMQQLFFTSASIGPMFGQRMHFSYLAPETVPYGVTRYEAEGARLQAVLETTLGDKQFFLSDDFSMVDIAHFGWVNVAGMVGFLSEDETPRLMKWYERVLNRPAVQKGLGVPTRKDASKMPPRKSAV